jgi:predicted ester cyclase
VPSDQDRATLLAFVKAVGSPAPLEPHLAADATFRALATGQVIRGRTAVAAFIRSFYHGAFAARGQLSAVVFDAADRLLLDLDLAGTHVGDFMGIPATGRRFRVRCQLACEARGGEIVAIAGHMPVDQLLAQLQPHDAD